MPGGAFARSAPAELKARKIGDEIMTSPQTGYSFPLRANGRYLVDRGGEPFFFQGDTLWMFGNINLPREELVRYLEHRVSMGFTVIQMMSGWKAGNSAGEFLTAKDSAGNLPFTEELAPNLWRLDRPDPAYFNTLRWFAEECGVRGLLVLIAPLWLGAGLQGFSTDLKANSEEACFAYGQSLGRRLGELPNVGWIHGGDRVPNEAERIRSRSIMAGIKSTAKARQLHTAHWRRPAEANLSREIPGFDDLDLELVYSASLTYYGCLRNWENALGKTVIPAFMGESYYEGQTRFDVNDDGVSDPWPRQMCRRQAYWSVLSGAGHTYGVEVKMGDVFHKATPENLNLPGTADMKIVSDLFRASGRRWWDLEPDNRHRVVTAGYGRRGTDSIAAHVGDDYVTAGSTPDGSLVMAYIPPTGTTPRTLTVDMAGIRGRRLAQWFNPATGAYTRIGEAAGGQSVQFTSSGDNGTGQNDWVLIIEA